MSREFDHQPEPMRQQKPGGPLAGLRVLEFAGVGPVQFTGMLLADLGADIIRIDRVDGDALLGLPYDILDRGRRSIALNLREETGLQVARRLIATSDVLIEGYRPKVMERLGLGPEEILNANPRLVYGRVTGWGQEGPLAHAAGHDINFIALAGALSAIGTPDNGPVVPLNIVGDFGAGGMLLAVGVLSALHEARRSGRGQVIDAAIVDGTALMLAMTMALRSAGRWTERRQRNLLDGGAPFYSAYRCSDDRWISIGPLEHRFFRELLRRLELDEASYVESMSDEHWPRLREVLAAKFRCRTRGEWCDLLEGSDVCFAPVLDLEEAPNHPHNAARGIYVNVDGVLQPAPAPRFSRTPGRVGRSPPARGEHTEEILRELGFGKLEGN